MVRQKSSSDGNRRKVLTLSSEGRLRRFVREGVSLRRFLHGNFSTQRGWPVLARDPNDRATSHLGGFPLSLSIPT